MWWLVVTLIPVVIHAQYYGKPLGSFVHSDGTSGDVYVADAKTLMVVNFNRKGEGCKTFLAGPTLAGLPEDRLSQHKEGVMLEISKRRSRPKRQAFNFVPKIPAMNSGHHILDWPFEFGHLRVDNGSPGFGAPSSPLDVEADEGSGEGRTIRLNLPTSSSQSTLAPPATTADSEATRAPLRIFTVVGGSTSEGITTDIAGPRRTLEPLNGSQVRPLQPVTVNPDRNRTSAERKSPDILPVISAGGQPIQIQPIRRIEHAPPRTSSVRTSAERTTTAAQPNSDLSGEIRTFGPWSRPTHVPRTTTEAPQPFTHVLGADETRRTWGPWRRESTVARTTTPQTPAGPLVVVFGGGGRNHTDDAEKPKVTADPSQRATRILNQNARRFDNDARTTVDFRAVQKPLPDSRREGLGLVSSPGGGAVFILGDTRDQSQPTTTRSSSRWVRPTAAPAGLSDARGSTEGVTVVFGSGHSDSDEEVPLRTPFPPLVHLRDRQPAAPATPAAPAAPSRSAPRRFSSAPSSAAPKAPQTQTHEDFVDSNGVMRVSFGSGSPIQLPPVRSDGGFAAPSQSTTTEEPGAFIDDEGVLRFQFGNPEEALERARRRQDSTELEPIPTRRPKPIIPWTTTPYPTTKMGAQFDLPEGNGDVLMVQFPDSFNLKDFSWFGVYDHCLQEREGYVNIPQSFEPPKEESIRGIKGWTADVNSGNIIILNCNTLVIQNFTYTNTQDKDAYIYVGMGEFPNHILQKVRTEVVGEPSKQPLRQYRGQDVMIRLPEGWRIFDSDWLAVFNPDENVSYGHTLIPSAWVPPCEDLV